MANPLRERDDDVYVLAEVSLSDVYPISGPDEEFDWPVPPAEYERKVEAMVRLLEEGLGRAAVIRPHAHVPCR